MGELRPGNRGASWPPKGAEIMRLKRLRTTVSGFGVVSGHLHLGFLRFTKSINLVARRSGGA